MLPHKIQNILDATVYSIVIHEFSMMLNPKYRGSNWDWKDFVSFSIKSVEKGIWKSFSEDDWNKYKKEILKVSKRQAKVIAEGIIIDSGILEWWDK